MQIGKTMPMRKRTLISLIIAFLILNCSRAWSHHDQYAFHIDCKFESRITELGEEKIEAPESFNVFSSTSDPSDSKWFTEQSRKTPGHWELPGKWGTRLFVSSGASSIDPDSFLIIYKDKSAVRTTVFRSKKSKTTRTLTSIGFCEIFE